MAVRPVADGRDTLPEERSRESCLQPRELPTWNDRDGVAFGHLGEDPEDLVEELCAVGRRLLDWSEFGHLRCEAQRRVL